MRYFRKSKARQDDADWVLPDNLSELDVECLKLIWLEAKDRIKSIEEAKRQCLFKLVILATLFVFLLTYMSEHVSLSKPEALPAWSYLFHAITAVIGIIFFFTYFISLLQYNIVHLDGFAPFEFDGDGLVTNFRKGSVDNDRTLSFFYTFCIQAYAQHIYKNSQNLQKLNNYNTYAVISLIWTTFAALQLSWFS